MLFQSILAVVAVLPAVFASPVVQGVAEREAEARSMMERAIEARQAYGSGYINTTAGLKWYTPDHTVGNDGRPDPAAYMCYSGPASVWPQNNCSWVNFNKMWSDAYTYSLGPIGDSFNEAFAVLNAILYVSSQTLVDNRVILAVILQESTGNVRVGCTNNGVRNCGIMQSYNGTSYDPNNMQSSITKMVQDGVQGTQYGPGLVQYMNDASGANVGSKGQLWSALRAYNSGRIDFTQLSASTGATASYVSDVLNRLQGWNGYGTGASVCGFQ